MHSSESSDPLDGKVLRKTKFMGHWSSCYIELHKTTLTVRKSKKSKEINKTIEITHETKIRYQEEGKRPKIIIENEDKQHNFYISCKDNTLLLKWLIALRGAAFYNPLISMESFNIISVLGRGFFGKVMLVEKNDTKELFALKTVHKVRLIKSKKVQTVLAERVILGKVNHQFIVEMNFAFQTSTKFYLGLEYVHGGDLCYLIKKFKKIPIKQVRLYIAEIVLALEYLHNAGVVYRDLKPENILIGKDGHLKLTDFGLSKDISLQGMTKTFCGTAEYMSPEIVNQKLYSYGVDWWALGILTYALLFGKTPFFDENRAQMFQNITSKDPEFPSGTSKTTKKFISGLLNRNPSSRLKYNDIINHPFFESLNFDDVLKKKYKPIYIPEIKDPHNPQNFDAEFTNEDAVDSIATPNIISEHNNFNGFSFVEDSSI